MTLHFGITYNSVFDSYKLDILYIITLLQFSYKDGSKISENTERYQVIREHSDSGFYELIIPVVKRSDAGLYKCIAKNKFGESTSEATVTVTGKKS